MAEVTRITRQQSSSDQFQRQFFLRLDIQFGYDECDQLNHQPSLLQFLPPENFNENFAAKILE